jgi:hypothetical protein
MVTEGREGRLHEGRIARRNAGMQEWRKGESKEESKKVGKEEGKEEGKEARNFLLLDLPQ